MWNDTPLVFMWSLWSHTEPTVFPHPFLQITHLCQHKETKKLYACKSISKQRKIVYVSTRICIVCCCFVKRICEHWAQYDASVNTNEDLYPNEIPMSFLKNQRVYSLCKSNLNRTKEDGEDVRREVAIMYHLQGHPNICDLVAAYEDKANVHLVMELCQGGELFDRIVEKGCYSELNAANVFRTIMTVRTLCWLARC